MFSRPIVIGCPSIAQKGELSNAELVQRLGGNSGNMLFTEAILRNIDRSLFYHGGRLPDDVDGIIIAAANWMNPGDDFSELASLIEATDLPAAIVGIGAQSSVRKEIPRVEPGTIRLMKIVSERSNVISTRGPFSCEVLEFYGIKNSIPTGCPSLLMCGPSGPTVRKHALGSGIVMHGTRHADNIPIDFQSYIYNQAYKLKADILLQSETTDLEIAYGSAPYDVAGQSAHIAGVTYRTENYPNLVNYLRKKAAFFYNLDTWIEYAKNKEFFVGTRIHGTVAALIAGTPALLIAHDSRTIELAQTMGIPYISSEKIDVSKDLDVSALFELCCGYNFPRYKFYRDGFRSFFEANSIPFNWN
ncbi:polysaccharide pyruvyl transferase family protein [Ensifer sp. 2TAB8]|uniref:polysaccharide pyruvyl transferase family protein n=1 Tax=Ensifer sp. 2TAB8 TaxID=3233006 RepID=UPI003F8E068A